MQQAISQFLRVAPKLTDELDVPELEQAEAMLNALTAPLSEEDIAGLISLLPANGDTAYGLNFVIRHKIEASPHWPVWHLLREEGHEWIDSLVVALGNAGIYRP